MDNSRVDLVSLDALNPSIGARITREMIDA